MVRTTLALEEELLRRLKQMAAEEGRSLQAVVNDLVRRALMMTEDRGEPYELRLRGWEAALQPGVDLLDRDQLFDLLDGR